MLENNGPDPFEKDANYKYFYKKIEKSKSTIKSILLNSKIISGIGNIYEMKYYLLLKFLH
ncbi:MAG: hypothetical protein Ct9H90mP19_2200 [Gammaproteobacteria bacterium]|nr:MAG: hypothetical protein Ct9H90mP19_2200 [Gammaproteobacteria bacterium]